LPNTAPRFWQSSPALIVAAFPTSAARLRAILSSPHSHRSPLPAASTVVGATTAKAEYPAECLLGTRDFLATIYRHLGTNPSDSLLDYSGRPIPILSDGEPIRELL
jgi:hypothetical protein